MKKLIFSLVVFSGLLIIGCQESFLTDPVQDTMPGDIQKNYRPGYRQGTFILEGILVNPNVPLTEYYSLNGKIAYEHQTVKDFPHLASGIKYNVILQLEIKAEITNPNVKSGRSYTVSGKTKVALYVPTKGATSFSKSYQIEGSDTRMNLVCVFEVKTDGVKLVSRWLEIPGVSSTDPD